MRRQDLVPGAVLLVELVRATRLGAILQADALGHGLEHAGVAAVHDAQHVAKALQVARVLILPGRTGRCAAVLGQLAAVVPLQGGVDRALLDHGVHFLIVRRVHGRLDDLQRSIDVDRVLFGAGRGQLQFADQRVAELVQEDAAHDADVHRHDAHVVAAEARIRALAPQGRIGAALLPGRVARRAATAAAAAPTATTARGQAARGRRRLGIGLARRDGEVGNAEGTDVIGHDADLRTGRRFIPDVADLLAVDDEARRAGQFNHADAVGAIQLGHIRHRGDVAALVALQAEQERVLVGRQFKQAQALVGAVVQHHADRSLGIRRLDHHIHVGHSARLRRRPDVHVQRLFAARRRSVAQREPTILHASGPALQHLLLDRAGQRAELLLVLGKGGRAESAHDGKQSDAA